MDCCELYNHVIVISIKVINSVISKALAFLCFHGKALPWAWNPPKTFFYCQKSNIVMITCKSQGHLPLRHVASPHFASPSLSIPRFKSDLDSSITLWLCPPCRFVVNNDKIFNQPKVSALEVLMNLFKLFFLSFWAGPLDIDSWDFTLQVVLLTYLCYWLFNGFHHRNWTSQSQHKNGIITTWSWA